MKKYTTDGICHDIEMGRQFKEIEKIRKFFKDGECKDSCFNFWNLVNWLEFKLFKSLNFIIKTII